MTLVRGPFHAGRGGRLVVSRPSDRSVRRPKPAPSGEPVKIPKPERQLNLALHMAARSRGIQSSDLLEIPGYNDDASADAREKRFDRDKVDMRARGVEVVWSEDHNGWSYHLSVTPPEPLPEVADVYGPLEEHQVRQLKLTQFERWLHIIYTLECGITPTLEGMAEYLGVKPDVVEKDLQGISLCCCGSAPHEHLDARLVGVRIHLSGPRLFR